ncbi:MAG: hypothetical protein ACRC0L_10360, partial [Angustibacter sp.]
PGCARGFAGVRSRIRRGALADSPGCARGFAGVRSRIRRGALADSPLSAGPFGLVRLIGGLGCDHGGAPQSSWRGQLTALGTLKD